MATIFALARFGGLRCPSEVLTLKWTDVLWDTNRLRIDSPKTGLRHCPLFPELRQALEEADATAAEGAVYCITRYRGSTTNLRTQLNRILERAGVEPWPKLFVNLRSTRRTELQKSHPDHAINKWLGHSGRIAEQHYLQVTDDDWQKAAEFGSPITTGQGPAQDSSAIKKPSDLLGCSGEGYAVKAHSMTPTGVEPVLPP